MKLSRENIFLCFVGPAGSGKTTVGKHLLSTHPESPAKIVTTTSRAPRPGEVEGVNYYFVSRDTFSQRADQGDFFEWEETHGNFYGTTKRALDDALAGEKDIFLDVDIRGALTYKKAFCLNCVTVFLVPPSPEAWKKRLHGRPGGNADLEVRIETAKEEYDRFLAEPAALDYLIVNDDLHKSCSHADSILRVERTKINRLKSEQLASLRQTS